MFSPYEKFDHPDKKLDKIVALYDAFRCKVRSFDLVEAKYKNYSNLWRIGIIKDQAVIKTNPAKPPPTGNENHQYLQQTRKPERMSCPNTICAGIKKHTFFQL